MLPEQNTNQYNFLYSIPLQIGSQGIFPLIPTPSSLGNEGEEQRDLPQVAQPGQGLFQSRSWP